MAEENAGGSEFSQGGSPATAIALAASVLDPGVAEDARHYLRKQVELANFQIEDMRREDTVRHWSLRVRHVSDLMKLAFELALAFIFISVAVGLASALWAASHDDSVIIEAFSVPPDMTQRGLTGQAVAAQLQDKLAALQAQTDSARPAESYANNWGDDIKVEIPNTGISISEFYRYLAGWLGHQTHITGEVFHTTSGVTVTARAGSNGGVSVSGSEGDFDRLMEKSAESIYKNTQPYRYAVYIEFHGDPAGARVVLDQLAREGSTVLERAWAYNGLGVLDGFTRGLAPAVADSHAALALVPNFGLVEENLDSFEGSLGHDEAGLATARATVRDFERGGGAPGVELTPRALAIATPAERSSLDFYVNDFTGSLRESRIAAALPDYSGEVEQSNENIADMLALLHQPDAARRTWHDLPPLPDAPTALARSIGEFALDYWLADWPDVLTVAAKVEADYASIHEKSVLLPLYAFHDVETRQLWPYSAFALAQTGDHAKADALIARTPLDCFVCLRIRGRIAALERDWQRTDAWFARATAFAPSIPLGWSDWGHTYLARGDYAAAMANFEIANHKGPHFADPLELWGEALMQTNRSDLAVTKFAEAVKYAPNWGRLHLKWGEALWWTGQKDEARKQFAAAAGLELMPAERSQVRAFASTPR